MAPATADGEIVAEFARMRIGNPLLDEAHSLFDNLRYLGRRCSVGPLPWGGVFGPPLTGKTMSVTTYIESSVVDELIRHRKFAADMDREEIARQQRTVTRSDWGMSVDMTIKGRKKASHFDGLRYCDEPGDRPLECFL
jgi:hypothetical protein